MEAQGYDKLVEALRDIEKTMFALGTSPINMDNVSIRLAYDKRWGPTANDAADAIEALQAQLPKHGEWIHIKGDDPWERTCSACMKKSEIHGEEPAFCPNCGADMRKMEVQDADT